MRRFVYRYCPAASRGLADCPRCDRVEMLAAAGVCPAAVAAATKIRSRTPVRSSQHWSCRLRNRALLFKKHCPRQNRRPLESCLQSHAEVQLPFGLFHVTSRCSVVSHRLSWFWHQLWEAFLEVQNAKIRCRSFCCPAGLSDAAGRANRAAETCFKEEFDSCRKISNPFGQAGGATVEARLSRTIDRRVDWRRSEPLD